MLDLTNGLPLPRARVELVYAGAPVKYAVAGGDGRYFITAVPAPYEVRARLAGSEAVRADTGSESGHRQ